MEMISARNNEKIKYAALLASSSKKREESGEFLIEGARLCSDAAISGIKILRAFITPDAEKKYSEYVASIFGVCSECYSVSSEVASKLSDTGNSQGVFCICKVRETDETQLDSKGRYIALENVQDPSNLGAVCRSCEALGVDGIIVSGGCDIYNPKALRAAMGSSLRINLITVSDLPRFIGEANERGMLTLASVPRRDASDIRSYQFNGGVIICVGNEGNGLTDETISACRAQVTIPMEGRAESLNASVAAAILAWELKR